MKNTFEECYLKETALEAQLEIALMDDDKESENAVRHEQEALEQEIDSRSPEFRSLYKMYVASCEEGNQIFNIDREIWDKDEIAKVVHELRENGVKQFAASDVNWHARMAWELCQAGCLLECMTEVKIGGVPYPAFVFSFE